MVPADVGIIFAPFNADCVGIFDPADDSFQLVDISAQLSDNRKFFGAVPAANGKIIFAPSCADSVGIFDPADDSFQLVDISARLSDDYSSAEQFRLPMARLSSRPTMLIAWASSILPTTVSSSSTSPRS